MLTSYKKGMRADLQAGRRPFIEAVPRLEILGVVGAARSGATRVHWLDQDDAVVGAANAIWCSSKILNFDFFTNQIGYVQEAGTCASSSWSRKKEVDVTKVCMPAADDAIIEKTSSFKIMAHGSAVIVIAFQIYQFVTTLRHVNT